MLDHFDRDMNSYSKAGSSCADFLGAFFIYIFHGVSIHMYIIFHYAYPGGLLFQFNTA